MNSLKGLGVALVTPFDVHNKIDFYALLKLLKQTAASGVDYWVVMGSTGEAITLSDQEQEEVLAFVIANNPTNLPIVFGLGGSNTAALIARLKQLDLKDVTALLSSSPAYNKPTQAGIIAHFTALAETSPIPIILYNVPSRTSSNMDAITTIALAKHPNIIAVKEASGDLEQVAEIIKSTSTDFFLTSGEDMLTPAIIQLGGQGAISVLANALPKEFKQLIVAGNKGYNNKSEEIATKLKSISSLMYEEGNPTGLKELLAQLSICNNLVRLPLLPATSGLKNKIRLALQAL